MRKGAISRNQKGQLNIYLRRRVINFEGFECVVSSFQKDKADKCSRGDKGSKAGVKSKRERRRK